MTTPADPVSPQPQTSDPAPAPGPTPAPSGTPTDQDTRDFVATLNAQVQAAIDASSHEYRKATVTAVTLTPPSIDVQFPAGTNPDGTAIPATTISAVAYMDHYSPVVGDTAIILKDGTDLLAIGQINDSNNGTFQSGWITASGSVNCRLVVDNGDYAVQFRGYMTVPGATLFTLPTGYRPVSARNVVCAAQTTVVANKAAMSWVRVQIGTDGVAQIMNMNSAGNSDEANGTTTPSSGGSAPGTDSVDPNDVTTSVDPGDSTGQPSSPNTGAGGTDGHIHTIGHDHGVIGSHSHGVVGSHSHTVDNHTHSIGHKHPLTVATPDTVWFDNVQIFL